MNCGDWGRYAHIYNLLSQSARFHLTQEEASTIFTTMEEQVSD
ncbi:unnamed protein product, partial [marine sediment metagenome]